MATKFNVFDKPECIRELARYRTLACLQNIYDGKQYEGRANWWTGTKKGSAEVVPLRERKPCVIYKLPKAMVGQAARFLFGGDRFPTVSVEDDKIQEADAEELVGWISTLIEVASLKPLVLAAAKRGISIGTSVVVLDVIDGELKFSLPSPADSYAEFENDDPSGAVTRFLWCYQFDKEVADDQGRPTQKRHWFRREWDAENVYVYDDVEIVHGKELKWGSPTVKPHGLSFCPVVWGRNEAEACGGIDGISLIADLSEEFEALDMALSKRHQGIIYLGAPQVVETGVEDGDGPDETGRKARSIGYSAAPATHGQAATRARRIGPQIIWTYEGKEVNVKLLETSGKAFEVGTNHVNDIRSRILEQAGVVLPAMQDTTGRVALGAEMSARFLELLHAPLIALVGEYRTTWWNELLADIILMAIRATTDLVASGNAITIPGSEKIAAIAAKLYRGDEWVAPRLKPNWGEFFSQSSQEIQQNVDSAIKARDGKLICSETAAEYVAIDFGVEDLEEEIAEIEEEETARAEREDERLIAEQEAIRKLAGTANEKSNKQPQQSDKQQQPINNASDSRGN